MYRILRDISIILYGRLCGGVEGNSYCEPKWFKSPQCDFLGSGPNLLLAIVYRLFWSPFEFYANRINIIYYYYYAHKYTHTYIFWCKSRAASFPYHTAPPTRDRRREQTDDNNNNNNNISLLDIIFSPSYIVMTTGAYNIILSHPQTPLLLRYIIYIKSVNSR